MQANIQEEPLWGHHVYEKVLSLSKGPGPFRQVARNRETGELVAIKFVPRGWDNATAMGHARSLYNHMELSMANHPHIVEMKGAFLTPYFLALVMEYVEGETVENFLEKVGGKVIEGLARFIMQQLVIAVDFCHRRGKLLRDIKLSNVLLAISQGQLPLVKLCDFTISRDVLRDHDESQPETSALFAAPELMQSSSGPYDGKAADLWSCGIVLYIMLYGRHPFMRDQDSELAPQQRLLAMMQRMMRSDVDFPMASLQPLSPGCIHLLKSLLVASPAHRMKMKDIRQHAWFVEALPEGAGDMNDLFIADSINLSVEQIGFFKALIKKASVNDGDCQLTPQTSQQHSGTSSQTLPMHKLHLNPRMSDATQGGSVAAQPQGGRVAVQTALPLPLLQSSGGDGGFVEMLRSGPSWLGGLASGALRGPSSAAMPTYLQQQLTAGAQKGSAEQAQWLSNLEDSVMSIPSQELLMAATQDIREKRSRPTRLESAPSLIAPRTLSELERSLCASSSFMREALAAGMTGMLSESQLLGGSAAELSRFVAAGEALGSPPQNGRKNHLVDAEPFLFEGGQDLPLANLSSMVTSFDWDSFNSAFAPGGELGAAAMAGGPGGNVSPAATAGRSAWGRVCKEVGVQLSKGNLGERPPSWMPGML